MSPARTAGEHHRPGHAPDGLVYPWRTPPAPGEHILVAAGVHWIRMPLPFRLDHINLWLLEDDDGWTLVDCGVDRPEVRALWSRFLAGPLADAPPRRIVATHFHPDHLGLGGWLAHRTGASLWMTRDEWMTGSLLYHDQDGHHAGHQIALLARHGLPTELAARLGARGNTYRPLMSAPPAEHVRLRDGDRLTIGGRTWQVRIGRGHAPEHACLHCPSLGVLIAGDQVLPRITPNVSLSAMEPDADPLDEYLQTLSALRDLPDDTLVLPSHRLPFRGLITRLDAIARHHQERLDALLAALAAPADAFGLLPVLFDRTLDLHEVWFAMGEMLAHLRHLEHLGSVRRVGRDPIRFVRA
ncbi:MAG: MBL fold metallo-hydrolase [Ectothiorhodospiraceae bacterium]|nr:MBL fold metallo-hydrolase [Chromatiales bacterium]MCP5157571.1 MBL fold metallo-hydrolase [Ectothiorhodospiraceae bacterium]